VGSDASRLFLIKSTNELLANHVSGAHNDLFKCLSKVKSLSNIQCVDYNLDGSDRTPTRMCLSRRGVGKHNNMWYVSSYGLVKPTSIFIMQTCSECLVYVFQMDWHPMYPTQ